MDSDYTHVLEYDGGEMIAVDHPLSRSQPVPVAAEPQEWRAAVGADAVAVARGDELRRGEGPAETEFLQAAGKADALMVDIRKPGGAQWGCEWVRYFVGRSATPQPLDLPIRMPRGTEMVSADEVFDADEAADLFLAYQQTGDLPPGYALRPVEGYRADGSLVEIPDTAPTAR